MRFMYIVTSSQPIAGPTPALMEAMGKLAEREIKAGRMLDSGGLMPVAMGAQVKITDGKLSVVDGPFVETKEMIGGYAIFELRNKEEAMAAAREFMQLHLDHMPGWEGTCEVRSWRSPGDGGLPGRARPTRCSRLMSTAAPIRPSAAMTAADVNSTILAVWRIEQPRLITGLSRMLRDVPLAEDLTQEALLAALEALARDRRAGQARRVADGDCQAPGARSSAPPPHARAQARDAGARPRAGAAGDARSRTRRWTTISATNCCG